MRRSPVIIAFLLGVAASAEGCGGEPAGGDGGIDDGRADEADRGDVEGERAGAAESVPDAGPEARDARDAAADETAGEAPDARACDPSRPFEVDKGALRAGDSLASVLLDACTAHVYRFTAAAGSTVRLRLASDGRRPVEAGIFYPDGAGWDDRLASVLAGWSPAQADFAPPRSGAFLVVVRGADPWSPLRYDLGLSREAGCGRETTVHPVLLVHGWTGWSEIGSYTYFYGVEEHLEERGFPVVVAELDPYNSTEVRSGQLAGQVDAFLASQHAAKVNIVAHSQGGLDARRAVSTLGYGDRVASITTVATPHRGTPVADVALGYLPGPASEALYFLLDLLGATATGREQEAEASFASITRSHVRDVFNPANPDDPRVVYISWTGLTCLAAITCGDVCDVEIRWSYNLIYLMEGPNDGMVPVSSAPWGDYRGEVPADHFDEVGQLAGVTGPNFDHRAFYLGIARDLAERGL